MKGKYLTVMLGTHIKKNSDFAMPDIRLVKRQTKQSNKKLSCGTNDKGYFHLVRLSKKTSLEQIWKLC